MSKKASIPESIKAHVLTAYDSCVACGHWDAIECGHIVAESRGGAMVKENFVRLCGHCNRAQGNYPAQFGAYAAYTESRAMAETNRAQWAAYCESVRLYYQMQDALEAGRVKRNGYKLPKPYIPAA